MDLTFPKAANSDKTRVDSHPKLARVRQAKHEASEAATVLREVLVQYPTLKVP